MKFRLIPLLLLLLLLCGCASPLIPDSYTVVTQHSEQAAETNSNALTATNYQELRYAILSLIEDGIPDGVIHVYTSYDGDLTKDIPAAAYDVWKNDPVGAYAVDFITTDCNLLLSYYEIRVEITYRRTLSELAAVRYVRGISAIPDAVGNALRSAEPRLALRVSAYYGEPDYEQIVEDYCAANAETIMERPALSVSVYPDAGTTRIVELNFTYHHTPAELRTMRTAVATELTSASNYVLYREEAASKAELLCSYLLDRFDYTVGTTETPVYSLLREGIADSRTFAWVFETLCRRVGLECVTVSGYLDGEPYCWNILGLNGSYSHVDLLRCVQENIHQLVLYTDFDMTRYSWDRSAYPICGLPAETAENPTEPEGEQPEASDDPEPGTDPATPPEDDPILPPADTAE